MVFFASRRGRPIASLTSNSTGRLITLASNISSNAKRRVARKSALVPMSMSMSTPIFTGAKVYPCGVEAVVEVIWRLTSVSRDTSRPSVVSTRWRVGTPAAFRGSPFAGTPLQPHQLLIGLGGDEVVNAPPAVLEFLAEFGIVLQHTMGGLGRPTGR